MPARRSKQELAHISAFVRALYKDGGYATWVEFADEAGVHPVQLSEWQSGKTSIEGLNLLKLIRAVALRRALAETDVAVAADAAIPLAADAGREMLVTQAAILRILQEVSEKVEAVHGEVAKRPTRRSA